MELVKAAHGVELGTAGLLLPSMTRLMEVIHSQSRTAVAAPMRLKTANLWKRTRRSNVFQNEEIRDELEEVKEG